MKQLLNSFISKYFFQFVSVSGKSRYFSQPRSIIVKYICYLLVFTKSVGSNFMYWYCVCYLPAHEGQKKNIFLFYYRRLNFGLVVFTLFLAMN